MAMTQDNLVFLRGLLHRRAAILLEEGKEYLAESRLLPVARQNGLATLDDLVARLRREQLGPLATQVIEAMTTNETSFFRDVHPFESLKSTIIPELMKARRASRTIRIWCAAASTGQEPYSLAILLADSFPELATGWRVDIVATDINTTVLERARSGIYKQLEVNRGLPATMLTKHFERQGTDWKLKDPIRKLVRFETMNLLDRWPFTQPLDLVLIRNVLIYFDLPTKKTILGRIRTHLAPDGYLMLGGAETTLNVDDAYQANRDGKTILYRHKTFAALGKTG